MRYLGIDYGTKKVGLALSDEAGTMGFPHRIMANDVSLTDAVLALITAEGVGAIVVGDSRNFSGDANPVAEAARAFGATLAERSGRPVFFEAEMLTTQEARRAIDGTHPQSGSGAARQTPRSAASREPVDASAAALILTSYLSRSHD